MPKVRHDFVTSTVSSSRLGNYERFDVYPGKPITVESYIEIIDARTGKVICRELLRGIMVDIVPEYTESGDHTSVQWTTFEKTDPSATKVEYGYIESPSGGGSGLVL